jgi:hypothetical protein
MVEGGVAEHLMRKGSLTAHSRKTEPSVYPERCFLKRTDFGRGTLVLVKSLSFLVIVFLLIACDTTDMPLQMPTDGRGGELGQRKTAPVMAIPPIDVAVPARTDTATFALG